MSHIHIQIDNKLDSDEEEKTYSICSNGWLYFDSVSLEALLFVKLMINKNEFNPNARLLFTPASQIDIKHIA